MHIKRPKSLGIFALLGLLTIVSPTYAFGQEPPVPVQPGQEGIEVQPRGPVHEAFAKPVSPNPEPGPLVPRKPPEPIQEIPPPQKPEGDNVLWIPGYWAWDAERKDFLWVSGVYRNAPPEMQFQPGYWAQEGENWRWVSGYWARPQAAEPNYLPQPPISPEIGPSSPQPDERSVYTPGTWVYENGNYYWRPGYWYRGNEDLVWIPPHYQWTPAGCIFIAGYWDYPVENRGLLFAPVYFTQPIYHTPGWCYRPYFALGASLLFDSLFIDPWFCHFHFGDYYGRHFHHGGFRPWFAYGRYYQEPLYNYYRFRHHHRPDWHRGLVTVYNQRFDGTLARPPRTLDRDFHEVRRVGGPGPGKQGAPLQLVDRRGVGSITNPRLTTLNDVQQRTLEKNVARFRDQVQNRSRKEQLTRRANPTSPTNPLPGAGKSLSTNPRIGDPIPGAGQKLPGQKLGTAQPAIDNQGKKKQSPLPKTGTTTPPTTSNLRGQLPTGPANKLPKLQNPPSNKLPGTNKLPGKSSTPQPKPTVPSGTPIVPQNKNLPANPKIGSPIPKSSGGSTLPVVPRKQISPTNPSPSTIPPKSPGGSAGQRIVPTIPNRQVIKPSTSVPRTTLPSGGTQSAVPSLKLPSSSRPALPNASQSLRPSTSRPVLPKTSQSFSPQRSTQRIVPQRSGSSAGIGSTRSNFQSQSLRSSNRGGGGGGRISGSKGGRR